MNGSWTLGTIVGFIGTIVVLLICLGFFIPGGFDPWFRRSIAGFAAIVMIGLAASPLMFYPYKKEYHYWEPTTGVIASVDKRLVGGGSSMEEKYIVTYEGDPEEYRVDDTRAALIEVGDTVNLYCKRVWEFATADWNVCRWGER